LIVAGAIDPARATASSDPPSRKAPAMFRTEFEFTLPKGYVDGEGTLHREGTMRLATAGDEILPLRDPRVEKNSAYLGIILLSRVVTRLGSVRAITTHTIENLYASDYEFLQDLYNRINYGAGDEPAAADDSDARCESGAVPHEPAGAGLGLGNGGSPRARQAASWGIPSR
jgi:hypothetical protein